MAAGVLVWALPEAVVFARHEAPSGFWGMAIAALLVDGPLFGVAGRESLRIRSTLSVCFTVAIFVVWGAAPAIVAQAVTGAVSVIGQRYRPGAGLFLVSRLVCALAAAALVVNLGDPRLIRQGAGLNGPDLLVFALMGAVWFLVSYSLLALARVSASPGRLAEAAAVRSNLVGTASSVVVVAPLLTTIAGWWTLLIAAPMVLWNQLAREQLRHEQQLSREPGSGLLNLQGLAAGVRELTAFDAVPSGGQRPFGIVLVSVESVLAINRFLGRDLYEKVIAAAARRLVVAYGADRAARLSGEAIVILMPDLTDRDALDAAKAAVAVLEPRIEVDGIPFTFEPTGGVALSPEHGRDLGTLLMRAELATGEARRSGRRAVLYAQEAAELTDKRVGLLRELHTVLCDPARHAEIEVLYQPQVELATGRLFSVEALLRWNHPQWGQVRTDELIEAVEPSDVMHLLTRHILQIVAAQIRRWNEQGEPVRVAVNASVRDLHEPDFVDELGVLLGQHAIAPRQLIIEITERMLVSDTPEIKRVAGMLAKLGVGLSLDDFGTGHASLQQLRRLPQSEVKVDRSYVSAMVDNPADAAIVASVHELARTLAVDMVAEGVEDERTAAALARLPGTIGQGWHFGRPMTVGGLSDWRRSR